MNKPRSFVTRPFKLSVPRTCEHSGCFHVAVSMTEENTVDWYPEKWNLKNCYLFVGLYYWGYTELLLHNWSMQKLFWQPKMIFALQMISSWSIKVDKIQLYCQKCWVSGCFCCKSCEVGVWWPVICWYGVIVLYKHHIFLINFFNYISPHLKIKVT